MRRFIVPGVLVGILLLIAQLAVAGPTQLHGRYKVAADELLIKLKPTAVQSTQEGQHDKLGGRILRRFARLGWQQIKLPTGMTIEQALQRYPQLAEVASVEPNYIYQTSATPNDPMLGQLWGLPKIQAQTAWESTTGSTNTVVAVIDSGINYNHDDLRNNVWRNPGEVAGNGVDDDGNGYVDDIYGINAYAGTANPLDDAGHGTHVAGIIGASGNNGIGVTGVNWTAKIMALKFIGPDGSGSLADAIACYEYAVAMKQRGINIRVINDSWGGSGYSQALRDAINAAGNAGILSVIAAGNDSSNIDATPDYPASYDLASIITVAASDQYDRPASFTNYGATSVDLAAPGVNIVSTYKSSNSSYVTMSGTSMASPYVAGAATLLLAKNPALTVAQLKSTLLNSVDVLSQWQGKVLTSGRMNLAKAMASISGGTTPPPPPPPTETYQPDMLIRTNAATSFTGSNVYSTGSDQSVSQSVATGTTATYIAQLQNDGSTSDNFTITGPTGGSGWTVRYYDAATGGSDITGLVTGTGWRVSALAPAATATLRVQVTPSTSVTAGATQSVAIKVASDTDATKSDTVRTVTTAITSSTRLTGVNLTVSPISPQRIGTIVKMTATPIGGSAVVYKYLIGIDNKFGGWYWVTLRNYSTQSTLSWQTASIGNFQLRVIVRKANDPGAPTFEKTVPYTITR